MVKCGDGSLMLLGYFSSTAPGALVKVDFSCVCVCVFVCDLIYLVKIQCFASHVICHCLYECVQTCLCMHAYMYIFVCMREQSLFCQVHVKIFVM